ncbi:MAG: hypothetical protein PHE68_05735 [Candidatus Peribacteraceae bacterium]|nr:hypothetical protein [Candidatus Peribacteraceae bacterium]MDD5074630.1 hypothetical protein [Candidatus Peribacteraceae bacterium]
MILRHFLQRLATVGVLTLVILCVPRSFAASSVPQRIVYNGHLLDAGGNVITTSHTVRFSLWSSTDYVTGDVTGTGAINTVAATYAGWKEAFTVTPNTQGYFTVTLGSTVSLPDFATLAPSVLNSLHLQIEVKADADPATLYEILDVDSANTSVDRAPLSSVPNALNADLLDQRDIGTGSGSIPLLGDGGVLSQSMIPGGTDLGTFTIDADGAATESVTLQFGGSLAKTITYDATPGAFVFNAGIEVQGTASGSVIHAEQQLRSSGSLVVEGATQLHGDVTISDGAGLTVSGSILSDGNLVINRLNAAQDALLTFGNDAGAETVKFNDTTDRFEFSDDVHAEGILTASGGLTVDGQTTLKSNATVGGNLTVTGLINGVDITQITSSVDNSHLKVSSGAGLNVTVARGDYRLGGNVVQYAGGTVAVPDNATSYVYLTLTGAVLSLTGFPTDRMYIPVASVQTSGGAVTSITDRRIFNSNDAQRTVTRTFEPMYEGSAFEGDGTENVGQLTVDHSGSTLRNFYQWTSTRGTLQDYDVILRAALPADFVRWGSVPVTLDYRSASSDVNFNQADVTVYDTAGATVTLTGSGAVDLADANWTTATWNFAGTPTWTAGGEVVIRIKLASRNDSPMQVGRLKLQYVEFLSE